jgi:hypothetical protein
MVYRGITAAATFLSLDFSEIRSKQVADQRAGSIDTVSSQIKQLSLEVDILGATAPTLAANAMVSKSPQSGDPLFNLLIAKVLNKTVNPGAAGEFLLNMDFSRRQNSFLKRLHLFGATVTDARVKKNGLEIFKASDAQNDQIQIEFQRTPQANQFTIDYCVDGDIKSALPLADAQTLEWYYTASGAGNVIAVAELLDPLTNN